MGDDGAEDASEHVLAPVRLVGVEHVLELPDDVIVEVVWAELAVTVNSVFQLKVYYKNVLD